MPLCIENELPTVPHARVDQGSILPSGHIDMRTQILNLFIFLVVINFALNIYILHYLIHIQFF